MRCRTFMATDTPDPAARPIVILVDADACPVKPEIYRVAARHGLKTFVVANSFIAVPREPSVERVVVGSRLDEADDWIAERARPGAIVITADVPLAGRVVRAGGEAIAPDGRAFTAASVGMALATRNLMADLREAGLATAGPRPFAPRDRSAFLQSLDRAIMRLKRAGFRTQDASPAAPGDPG